MNMLRHQGLQREIRLGRKARRASSRRERRSIWVSMASGHAGARTSMARLQGCEFLETPNPKDREDAQELVLSYQLDRFVEGALEIATLVAVTALFVPVLM
jgi:hypothetical protein